MRHVLCFHDIKDIVELYLDDLSIGINNTLLSNIFYLLLFPNLGVHLSPYLSFGATGAIGAIGTTSSNAYIIGSHSKCHQQFPSFGCS